MRKFFLSFALIAAFALYAIIQKGEEMAPNYAIISAQKPTSAPAPVLPRPQPRKNTTAIYKDGEYIGSVADAYYGNVQIKILIQNGRITGVQFLQYPNDRSTSIQINSEAMPYLKEEAIRAQSSEVDVVSGATQTSGAFRESLASALNQAKN